MILARQARTHYSSCPSRPKGASKAKETPLEQEALR